MSGGKLRSLSIACLLGIVAAGQAYAEGSPGDCPSQENGWRCGYVARKMLEFQRGGGSRGPGDPQPETPYTDVLHTKIDVEVDMRRHTFFGIVTITAEARINDLTEFTLYLHPNGGLMNLTEIGGNVAGPTNFTHVGDKVTVTLDGTYASGQEFTIWLDYGGTPYSANGVYWDSHGSPPVEELATMSAAWHSRNWWVGKDVLNDKCTFDIWVTVPDVFVVVSNGILRGVDPVPPAMVRYRWEEINPMIPYLASLAITDYEVYSTTYNHLGDTMPMDFYILPENNTPTYQGHCDAYVTMTEVFSDVFGQYPFVNEKGGMAETPALGGTFMEHQTIPSMPWFGLLWVQAHELAHQWWGDNITCETWGDTWLNEGITSYCEAIWEEFKPGGSMAAYHARMAARLPYSTDPQVYVTDVNSEGAVYSSIVYDKGAWVTHMLRHVIGDETFFQALLDYRAAFEGDSATTEQFTNSVSTTAGYDISYFTDQWVMNPGSPDYEYQWRHSLAGGQDYLLLHIAQTQGDRGYDLMTMPVDIAVTTPSGTNTYIVWCIDEVEAFAIPVDGGPTQVALDPDSWILTHSVALSPPIAFTTTCQGDMNEDGETDGLDIQAFAEALLDPATWPSAWRRSDMDFNGRCDMDDLPLFVEALLGGCELS